MCSAEVVPKRRVRVWPYVLGVVVLALAIAAYVSWTRLSARMALRWFVKEAGLPVEVVGASWDVRIRELLQGKIRALHLNLIHKPTGLEVEFDSPVEYLNSGAHWSIRLSPDLTVGALPPIRGTVALELDIEHENGKMGAANLGVELHLHEIKPLELESPAGKATVRSWNVDGWVGWASQWSSHLDLSLKDVTATRADATMLAAKTVKIGTDLSWPSAPPFPVDVSADLEATELSFMRGSFFVTEPRAHASAAFYFDGKNLENAKLAVDKPVPLTAEGSLLGGVLAADVSLKGSLDELFTRRAAQWFSSEVPLLRNAKASGALSVTGHVALKPGAGPRASGRLKLSADKVEIPMHDPSLAGPPDLAVSGLYLEAPLSFPDDPDWGSLVIKAVDFHSVTLRNLAVETRLATGGIDVTTEDRAGNDRPIRQSVWGGSIDIEDLYAHVGGDEGTEFTASIKGGPFQIPAIQSDLCLLPDHPIKGQLSFTYPELVLDKQAITLAGDINVEAFNGKAHVGDLRFTFGERNPRLSLNLDWSDLDLQAIGQWTNLGDIRGSLFGSFEKADLALTPDGVIPNNYELTIRGSQRGGNKVSFYGRALKNVMAMFGASFDSLPPTAAFWLNLTMLWRNWLPAHADVMGFQALANRDWTTLTTFDLPEDADAGCDSKNHYILCGTGFTIPLNTHGVYPLVMRTISFHEWLNDRVKYVQDLMKSKLKTGAKDATQPQCTPFF